LGLGRAVKEVRLHMPKVAGSSPSRDSVSTFGLSLLFTASDLLWLIVCCAIQVTHSSHMRCTHSIFLKIIFMIIIFVISCHKLYLFQFFDPFQQQADQIANVPADFGNLVGKTFE
jgi:hypothetical protein